ncbi:MAG: GNAT family N-acetyltransferase [Actinomycetota bacterium]
MTDEILVRAAPIDDLAPRLLHELLRLRVDVFVVEQECAYPELDTRDVEPGAVHLWTEADDGSVAAVARLLDDGDERRIGRIATRTDQRGAGLAARLIDVAIERSEGPWVLDAQAHLAGWYERFGFVAEGHEFLEDGIPHVTMRRRV